MPGMLQSTEITRGLITAAQITAAKCLRRHKQRQPHARSTVLLEPTRSSRLQEQIGHAIRRVKHRQVTGIGKLERVP